MSISSPLLSFPEAHFGQVKKSNSLLKKGSLLTLSLLASPIIANTILSPDKAIAARNTGNGGGFTGSSGAYGGGAGANEGIVQRGPTYTGPRPGKYDNYPSDYYSQPNGTHIPAQSYNTGQNHTGVSTGQTRQKGALDCFTVSALERKGGWQPEGYDRDQLRVAFHQEYNAKLPYVGNLLRSCLHKLA